MYPNSMDVMQWLADSNLLEMIVDKLSPSVSKTFHFKFMFGILFEMNFLGTKLSLWT